MHDDGRLAIEHGYHAFFMECKSLMEMEVGFNVKDLAHLQERYGPFPRILEKPEIDCVGSCTADCLDFIMWILMMLMELCECTFASGT